MSDDPEVQRHTVRLVLKLGARAPGFAKMLAQQFDDLGDARQTEIWQAVAAMSANLLQALSPRHGRLAAKPHH